MEVLGGNGYVEEGILGRLYREMPVNSIWEGSGNVMCLDVLRALGRSPETRAVLAKELGEARGADRRLDQAMAALQADLEDPAEAEARARRTVERLMLVFQATLLVRHAPSAVSDAFIRSRIEHDASGHYGALPRGIDLTALVERAAPLPL
jgi:putative acyl-CoA dehydrogenase